MSSLDVGSPQVAAACAQLGWPGLRPVQRDLMEPILAGRDVVAVVPTSGGKSGLFQIPALARPGLVVVVSPLIALMVDQVDKLRKHHVAAAALHSHVSTSEKKHITDQIREGDLDLLYVSPERLTSMGPKFFEGSNLQMVAIDEAHCISEWGHDFRPPYLRLGRMIARYDGVQKLALTATATSHVAAEIARVLDIDDDAYTVRYSPDRHNITYMVCGADVSTVRMVKRTGLPCLVYGSTRRSVELAAAELSRAGYRAAHYHAGLSKDDRNDVQNRFMEGGLEVVAATCAFGMGVDHSGIRGVVHLEMATSLEAYTQEAGRAGRDGKPSLAICRATVETLRIARSMVASVWPHPDRVRELWRRIQMLFDDRPGKWTKQGQLHMTIAQIAAQMGRDFDEQTTGSAIRILIEAGALSRVAYGDLPMRVHLNRHLDRPIRGPRATEVMHALNRQAGPDGTVTGSVSYFRDLGLDKSYAAQLVKRNYLRVDWPKRAAILQRQLEPDAVPELDDDRLVALARRMVDRIDAAEGYLTEPYCRRGYLLSYFGDIEGGEADGLCCDRCVVRSRSH